MPETTRETTRETDLETVPDTAHFDKLLPAAGARNGHAPVLLCTDTQTGDRTSTCVSYAPGVHLAHILRGTPICDLKQRQGDAYDPNRPDEDDAVFRLNIEEAGFIIERLSAWLREHEEYMAANPSLFAPEKYTKSYTAEVI